MKRDYINKILELSKIFVKIAQANCSVDYIQYENNLLNYLNNIYDDTNKKLNNLENVTSDSLIEELKNNGINDENLFNNIINKNDDEIFEILYKNKEIKSSLKIKIIEFVSPPEFSKEDIEENFSNILDTTKQNMNEICDFINQAISRISEYENTQWVIIPEVSSDYSGKLNYSEPAISAQVISSSNKDIFFSIFKIDNTFDVGDIIDDEEDIDVDFGWQNDYYKLINEIKKPGSTSVGKNITLYTARPRKDREFYENTNTLPNGIYLTNNLSSAEGLATELAFSGGIRDVWKVKINSKYLLQTLNGPEKQYRIASGPEGAPIIGKMTLV